MSYWLYPDYNTNRDPMQFQQLVTKNWRKPGIMSRKERQPPCQIVHWHFFQSNVLSFSLKQSVSALIMLNSIGRVIDIKFIHKQLNDMIADKKKKDKRKDRWIAGKSTRDAVNTAFPKLSGSNVFKACVYVCTKYSHPLRWIRIR